MKYCIRCGSIYSDKYDFFNGKEMCMVDGSPLIEDESMSDDMFYNLSEKEKDEYEKRIYNICKQSEFFDEKKYNKSWEKPYNYYYTYRFDKYEKLTGEKAPTKENHDYHMMLSQKRVAEAVRNYAPPITPKNVPRCPTCQSENIRKIGGLERGASIGLFGLFSKKINKTFKCNNCGYTW